MPEEIAIEQISGSHRADLNEWAQQNRKEKEI